MNIWFPAYSDKDISLTVDLSNAVQQLSALDAEFQKLNVDIASITGLTERYNKAGALLGTTIQGITSDGQKFSALLRRLKSGGDSLKYFALNTNQGSAVRALKEQSKIFADEVRTNLGNLGMYSDVAGEKVSLALERVAKYMVANNITLGKARNLYLQLAAGQSLVGTEFERFEYLVTKPGKILEQDRARLIRKFQVLADKQQADLEKQLEREAKAYERHIRKLAKMADTELARRAAEEEKAGVLRGRRLLKEATQDEKQYNSTRHNPFIDSTRASFTALGKASDDVKARVIARLEAIRQFMIRNNISNAEGFAAIANAKAGRAELNTGPLAELAKRVLDINEVLDPISAKSKEIFLTWTGLARLALVQILHRGISSVASALTQASQEAAKYQLKISQVRTISQDAQLATSDWSNRLRNLSDAFGIDILDVADAAYESISNQITKGADSTRFLTEALTLARVTASSTAVASNVLATVMNAYGTKAKDAQEISALLFQTIDFGRVKLEELDYSLATAAPLTASLGVNFEELLATISALTIKGIKFDTTATGINNIMAKMLSPSKELQQLFGEWGVSSGQAAISLFGFAGVLERLGKELESGGASRLGDLLPDIRGLRAGIAALTAGSLDDIKKFSSNNLQAQRKFIEANRITVESLAQDFIVDLNKVRNILTVDFGNEILAFVSTLTKAFGGLTTVVKAPLTIILDFVGIANSVLKTAQNASELISTKLSTSKIDYINSASNELLKILVSLGVGVAAVSPLVIAMTAAFGSYTVVTGTAAVTTTGFAIATKYLAGAWASLNVAMAANPFVFAAGATLAALTALLVYTNKTYKEISQIHDRYIADNQKKQDSEINEFNKGLEKRTQHYVSKNEEAIKAIYTANLALRQKYTAELKRAIFDFDTTETNILEKLEERIKKTKNAIADLLRDITTRVFEKGLDSENFTNRINSTIDRLRELDLEGKSAIFAKNFELARNTFKDMSKMAEKLVDDIEKSIKDTSKNIKKLGFDKEKAAFEGVKSDNRRDTLLRAAIAEKLSSSKGQSDLGNYEEAKRLQEEAKSLADMIKKEKLKSTQKQIILDEEINLEKAVLQLRTAQLQQALIEEKLANTRRQDTERADQQVAQSALDVAKALKDLNDTETKQIDAIKKNTEALLNAKNDFKSAYAASVSASTSLMGRREQLEAFKNNGAYSMFAGVRPIAEVKFVEDSLKGFQDATLELAKVLNNPVSNEQQIQKARDAVSVVFSDLRDASRQGGITEEFKKIIESMKLEMLTLDQVIQDRLKAVDTIREANKNRPKGMASGGVVGGNSFAYDSTLIRANRGEMIMNNWAAENFYPLLAAMNERGNTTSRQSNVHNTTNIGDIHVTYDSSKTSSENVRSFTRQLQRELQRGSVRLS